MGLHDLLRDGKSQARTGRRRRPLVIGLVELLKDTRELIRRDTRARIVHLEMNRIVDRLD